jgi:hypothetical protein
VAGVLSLAVVGCTPPSGSSSKGTSSDASLKKDEAINAMKMQLDELDKKAADLKNKAEKATGEEKTKLEAKWKELAPKREAAAKKLEELKTTAAEKWDAAKKETDHAFHEFRKALE